jgi:hypothetical protein
MASIEPNGAIGDIQVIRQIVPQGYDPSEIRCHRLLPPPYSLKLDISVSHTLVEAYSARLPTYHSHMRVKSFKRAQKTAGNDWVWIQRAKKRER